MDFRSSLIVCVAMGACTMHVDKETRPSYVTLLVAHELGHAAGFEHSEQGLMSPIIMWNDPMPSATDWQGERTHPIDCLEWRVDDRLVDAFQEASDAWCEASAGEFCPLANPYSDCTVDVVDEIDGEPNAAGCGTITGYRSLTISGGCELACNETWSLSSQDDLYWLAGKTFLFADDDVFIVVTSVNLTQYIENIKVCMLHADLGLCYTRIGSETWHFIHG